ncbi:MAG: hypothetical protein P8O79_10225 [Halieaceae bacterium]|nr:hypothetical protein [Halieaceae bacterium]
MKVLELALATALLATTTSALAAKPTSIRYITDIENDEKQSKRYEVQCSDKRAVEMTQTTSNEFCALVGNESYCSKRKMKVAKQACK